MITWKPDDLPHGDFVLPSAATKLRAHARTLLEIADEIEIRRANDVAPEMVPLEYVASHFSIGTKALRARIRRGELAACKVGKRYLVKLEDARVALAPTVAAPTRPALLAVTEDDEIRARLRAIGVRAGGDR